MMPGYVLRLAAWLAVAMSTFGSVARAAPVVRSALF